MRVTQPFSVALTADFYDVEGRPKYQDIGMSMLEAHTHVRQLVLQEHRAQIESNQLSGVNAVIVLTPAVTARTVSQAENLLAVGRFGVGYDAVDVAACTEADVLVFIAAGAVDRSVAEATVGWMLALTHHIRIKDQLVRTGQWDQRSKLMGCELRDRALGVIGLGGIARQLISLLSGWGMKQPMAYDPFVTEAAATEVGARLVTLDQLLSRSDFISIHCPLNDNTRGLIGERELSLMKPSAYLINTARGGIVDERALHEALARGRLAGSAIDCFSREPVTSPHPLGELDSVLLAPHSIAWTEELFRDIGLAVCQGMIDLSLGRRPKCVVNPQVFQRASFLRKWARLCGCTEGELCL